MIKLLRNPARREERRGYLISAYVGGNGGGKTACMIWDSIPALEAGRPVLSTVRILDYNNPRPCNDEMCADNPDRLDHFKMRPTPAGREAMIRNQKRLFLYGPTADLEPVERRSTGIHQAAHPLWIPWTTWEQLLTIEFGEVLADEMTGIAEARAAQSLPVAVVNQLQQLRRSDIPFRYTCPSWERADLSLRQPTQTVTLCKGRFKKVAPMEGDLERVVKIRRLLRWKTYDAQELTELTEGKRAELKAEVGDWYWGPGSPAWLAYDTFAPVLTVGFVTEAGRCHKCNGTRPVPKCMCGPTVGRNEAGSAGAPARRRASGEDGRTAAPDRCANRRTAQPDAPAAAELGMPEFPDTPTRVGDTALTH